MPVVVVDKPQFLVVVFAAPLDGLGDVPFGGDFSVGRVGVGRTQVAGFPEDFRDVPGQIPPVGVPGAVLADGQRARSLRLRRVPEQEPSEGSADGIYGGYLQVATVHVAQVAAHRPVDAHFAGVPPAHVVVGAFHHGFGAFIDEAHRAVFRVVGDLPDAGGCPDQCLIAVRVVNRFKGGFFSALDGGVLVERAGCVGGRFFRVFPRGFPVADVVVTVAVCLAADGGGGQFAPAVAGKAVVDGIPLAGRAPRDGPCQTVVSVFPSHNQIPEKVYKYFLYSVFILNFIIIFTLIF